jgi:ribonuclease P protein component
MKYFRLKKQSDFQKLFQKGKRAFSPSLMMIYKKSDKLTMGISVGKKHGKSVQRNRIKRLLREAFRSEMGEIQGTYHIVLLPKAGEKYSYHTFKTHLQCMIKKEKM